MDEKTLKGRCQFKQHISDTIFRRREVTTVALGTLVTQRPPHRSERAALPHSALASGDDAKAYQRIRMTNTGRRKPPVHEGASPQSFRYTRGFEKAKAAF